MNFRFSTCALLCASLFLSCHSNPEEEVTVTVPYTFEVFSTSTGSLDDLGTRAPKDSEVRNLLVVDVKDDMLYQKVVRIDTIESRAVGLVKLDLPFGKHQICFLASTTPWAEFDEQTLQVIWNKEKPLYSVWSKVVEVNVKPKDKDGERHVALDRVVAFVSATINDKLPENLYSFRQTLQGGSWTYDVLNQTGGVASQITHDYIVPAENIGKAKTSIGIYTFLPDGVNSVSNYTVMAYDEHQNVIQFHSFDDVPLVQNRYTNYVGNFFSVANTCGFQINKTWDTPNIIEY